VPELVVGLGIPLREAAEVGHGARVVRGHPQVAVVERLEGAVEGEHL
jgi:hypothetical protein